MIRIDQAYMTKFSNGHHRSTSKLHLYLLSLLLFSLATAWACNSHAAEQEEWTYSMAPGDNLWTITTRYLNDGVRYWKALIRLNKITDPLHMPPGTKLRIPLQWLKVEQAIVLVRDVYGNATFTGEQQASPKALKTGMILAAGDQVMVGEGANVLLEFADLSRLFLSSKSQVKLTSIKKLSSSGLADSQVKLIQGRVENSVKTKNTRFQITTPSANTAVRGTSFRVAVDQSNTNISRVEVLKGVVNTRGSGSEQAIKAGFGTTVARGEAPRPPVRLLPPPEINEPSSYSRKLPVDIKWQMIAGAKNYRIQIREAAEEQTVVIDETTSMVRFSTNLLEDGHFIIAVRAIDSAGLEGKNAERALHLDARPQPPLAISPKANETVRTELISFEWTSPPQGESYHFLLAENQDLSSPVIDTVLTRTHYSLKQLSPGTYYWRLSTLAGTEEGPYGQSHKFTLRPTPKAPAVLTESTKSHVFLRWQAGAPGQKYKVQLSSDSVFSKVGQEEQLLQAEWTIKRPKKTIYFRVRVIDIDGFEGDWSPAQKIALLPDPWYYPATIISLFLLLVL